MEKITKIKLNANETMLFLLTKRHASTLVPQSTHQPGSMEYIQECCDKYVACEPGRADIFDIYILICEELLSPTKMGNILRRFWQNWFDNLPNTRAGIMQEILHHMLMELQSRRISDLELDTALIIQYDETEKAMDTVADG